MKCRPALVLVALCASACKTPTEVSIVIRSDVAYREDMAVAVAVDAPERIEDASPRVVVRQRWVAGGSLGDVVAVPSNDRSELAVRVVLATGRDPSTCSVNDAAGCIVVRRRLDFVRGESARAEVVLRPICLGVYCEAGSSCAVDGTCGSLTSDEATGVGGDDGVDAGEADPYAALVLADRPRHYYRLDEPEGAAVARDRMGRADGAVDSAHVRLGATGALTRSSNTGAFFDGGGSIAVAKAESANGAATVEAWIRSDASDAPDRSVVERVDLVAAEPYGFRLAKPRTNGASFAVFRGPDAFEVTTPKTRFAGYSHVVAVTRGPSIEIYLNGLSSEPARSAASPTALVGPLVIGGSHVGHASFLGAIDEVAIYDYPLTREQILRHYEVGAK